MGFCVCFCADCLWFYEPAQESDYSHPNINQYSRVAVFIDRESCGSNVASREYRALTVTATYADGTKGTPLATWGTNDASVATVNSSGVVTGLSRGAARITASVGDYSASTNITVASSKVVIGTPTPSWPIAGRVLRDFTPHFTVINGTNTGTAADIGTVYYEIQVVTSFTPLVVVVTASTQAGTGSTRIALRPAGSAYERTLTASTTYHWRARGRNYGSKTHFAPGGTVIEVDASPWSNWYMFKTADVEALGANAPYNCCPPANRFSVVQRVAAEIGYPWSGVDVRTLTQKVAEELYVEDNRWGRVVRHSGTLGRDEIAYKTSLGSGYPYVIDIVSGTTIKWDVEGFKSGNTWVQP